MTAPRKPPQHKPAAAKWGVPWRVREGEGTIIETDAGDFVAKTTDWHVTTRLQKKRGVALAQFIVTTVNGSRGGEE